MGFSGGESLGNGIKNDKYGKSKIWAVEREMATPWKEGGSGHVKQADKVKISGEWGVRRVGEDQRIGRKFGRQNCKGTVNEKGEIGASSKGWRGQG